MPRLCLPLDLHRLVLIRPYHWPSWVSSSGALDRRHNSNASTSSTRGSQKTMRPACSPLSTADNATTTDYTTYSTSDLISRITALESKLREQTAQIAASTTASPASLDTRPQNQRNGSPSRPSRRVKPFNPSLYSTRHIALKFSYLGQRYNGYEHANGTVPPKPTIEEVLWKALRKARLISPDLDDGADQSFDVVWDRRADVYTADRDGGVNGNGKSKLSLNWEGCQYSKCGRTDRGVSAFGQVIGVRVRSNRPLPKLAPQRESVNGVEQETPRSRPISRSSSSSNVDGMMSGMDVDGFDSDTYEKAFDPINDELPYVSILNSILPSDIRILAWCPDPPANFDARFSCRERRYKYFFTNPAFCPTPGPTGLKYADGTEATVREGWLDIAKMREAAKKLEGLHDFRNLCKIDASKQMSSCERRITFADIQEVDVGGGTAFGEDPALSDGKDPTSSTMPSLPSIWGIRDPPRPGGPKVYAFAVHGSAFLWHQVRCMVAILFLVGQGLEDPSVVDDLLDVEKNPGRPMYEMADDAPLVLWDCIFPDDGTNSLRWIYAGDESTIPALTTKGDGKYGLGGVVDELWTQWRSAKMQEILAGRLLDLAIGQGDRSALHRGGFRDPPNVAFRSQKVFDGSETARMVGAYVPVMKKPTMDALEAQNAKYVAGRLARRGAKKAAEAGDGDDG